MTTAFGKDPLSTRGRWVVIAVATAVMQLSYWPVVAVTAWEGRRDEVVAAGVFVGLAAVPFVFMLVAFVSRHPRAPWAVLRAMALFALVGAGVGWLHVAAGMAAGYAAGGVAALRWPEGTRPRAARIGMVAAITVAVTLVVAVEPAGGAALAALLPFPSLGLADEVAVRSAQQRR